MINYYYEIKEGIKVFGHPHKYLAHFDVKPGETIGWRAFHDEAVLSSTRVWLENANGVTLVKAPSDDNSWGRVNNRELVWLKLICKDVESL